MRRTGARGADAARRPGIDAARRPGVSMRRACDMPGASTRRAEAGALALRTGPGASTQHAGAGTLMQCAGALTRHAGVSTQHAGTGGVDGGQGCSQGGGRQHEKNKPLRLALEARGWLWRNEKQNPHPLAFEARVGIGAREPSVSRLERDGGTNASRQQTKHVTFT
jgi:hypothetical protein